MESISTDPQKWFPYNDYRRQEPQTQMRLFCLPFAGGRALAYRSWRNSFPAQIDVIPVELPGRGARMAEPLFRQLPPLLSALTAALEPYLNTPLALFGHSLGGLLSFELARTLRERHQVEPTHLFVSACRAPHLAGTPTYHLPDEAFIARIRHLNGTPEAVLNSPALLALLLPIFRADFALYDSYEYRPLPPLPCPISVFGGSDDATVHQEQLDAWKLHTIGRFNRHLFPGGHFYIQTDAAPVRSRVIRTLLSG